MPTRIDIELTSAGSDGSWTWRAAGAREPRGTLDGSILPEGASVGDQLKVESEKDIDGIRILSIVTPKPKDEREGILELLPTGEFEPVIQQRATRDRHEAGRGRPRRDRGERGDRRDRDERGPRGERSGPSDRPSDRHGERRGGPRRDDGERGGDGERRHQRPHFTPPPELPQRPKPKRLRPGKQRRSDVLAEIPEEQRPVAELALQGMAAVRQRLREDNARLRAEQKPEMPEATVLKMAESLLPQLRVADWLDRADAAKRQLAHLDLRDLRSVVAASDDPVVARDESTRDLAAELKAALVTKQDEELNLWLSDVEAAVEVGRVVRALRLSAMPPKAGVPFPHELGTKLGDVTTASLSPDDPADRWIAVLEAAAFSPVRAHITPTAAPAQPAAELVATVTRLSPLLPQVAALFGIEVPEKAPIPKPLRPTPRKKEAPMAGDAAPRHGKVASHPGPKPDRKPATGSKAAAAAESADVPKSEVAEVAEAPAASVAPVADAPEPEVTEVAEAPEAEAAALADAPEAEVADVAQAEVTEADQAPEAEAAPVADAAEPEVTEVAEPEVAAADEAPEAEDAKVADAREAELPGPEVTEVVQAVQAPGAEEADVADAPEAEIADTADTPPDTDAPEPEVAEAPEPVADAPQSATAETAPTAAATEPDVTTTEPT